MWKNNYKIMSLEQLANEYKRLVNSTYYDELKNDRLEFLKIEFAIKNNCYFMKVII